MTPKTRRLADYLHIFVLTSFALAQPLFDRLSHNRAYLADQSIKPAAIFVLVSILSVVVPALIALLDVGAGLFGRRVHECLHAGVVCLLVAAIALPTLRLLKSMPGMLEVPLSLVLGAICVIAYRRYDRIRLLVTAAAPAVVLFPVLFLFHSPITSMLFPQRTTATAQVSVGNPLPVVMVVFDEFCGTSLMNEDRVIDAIRYPNFAALAREATWFRNASSVHPRTDQAVPAILTGNYPLPNRLPTVADHPQNLFTLLLHTGSYELTVFEPFTRLFPAESDIAVENPGSVYDQARSLLSTLALLYLHHLFPPDLPFSMPDIPRQWFGLKDTAGVNRDKKNGVLRYGWNSDRDVQFEHFLECITPSEKPRLYFQHVVLPHFAWCYLPSGTKYAKDAGHELMPYGVSSVHPYETWDNDELVVNHGHQRYLLQVGYTDHLIGKLIARLKEIGLYDRCLLIVMSDHGVSFRPKLSRRSPTEESLADILSIPLFIKLPNQHEGSISDRNVASIDVLPTITDLLGISPPWELDGRSVYDESQPERAEKVFDNEERRATVDSGFESKHATLERMLATFGSGERPDGLFRIGPHTELIGQAVKDLDFTDGPGLRIDLTYPDGLVGEQPRALVPCYFEGRVRAGSQTKLPVDLAIAVNGTIQAVTRTYRGKGITNLWTAMVPESSLQQGQNDVQIFIVSAAGGTLRLTPTLTQ